MALATGIEIDFPAFLKATGKGSRAINQKLRDILLKHAGSLESKIRRRAPRNRGTLAAAIKVRLKGSNESYILQVYVSARGDANTPSPFDYYLQREFGGPVEGKPWLGWAPSKSPLFGKRVHADDLSAAELGYKRLFGKPLKKGGRGLFGGPSKNPGDKTGRKVDLLMIFKQTVDQKAYSDGRFILPSIREQKTIIAGEIRRRMKDIVFG